MKVGWQDIGQLNDNETDSIQRAIIVPAKEALRQTRQALTGNLTIGDNQYAAIVTLGTSMTPITSGTEWTFANPLKTKPIGFTLLTATNTAGVAIQLDSPPKLNTSRTDGLMGLTAILDVNSSTGSIGERLVEFIPRASGVSVTTNAARSVAGVTLTPGTWDLSAIGVFAGTPTGTDYVVCISQTTNSIGASTIQGDQRTEVPGPSPTAAADLTLTIPCWRTTVAAATSFFMVCQLTISAGTATAYGRLSATRSFRYDSNPMIVTGILWGG